MINRMTDGNRNCTKSRCVVMPSYSPQISNYFSDTLRRDSRTLHFCYRMCLCILHAEYNKINDDVYDFDCGMRHVKILGEMPYLFHIIRHVYTQVIWNDVRYELHSYGVRLCGFLLLTSFSMRADVSDRSTYVHFRQPCAYFFVFTSEWGNICSPTTRATCKSQRDAIVDNKTRVI